MEHINGHTMDGENFQLLNKKNRGGLIKPSKSVVDVCFFTEKKIRQVLNITENCMPNEKIFMETFIHKVSVYWFKIPRYLKI